MTPFATLGVGITFGRQAQIDGRCTGRRVRCYLPLPYNWGLRSN
jgi:hypothetical protein